MDLLAQVLSQAGLRRRLLNQRSFGQKAALRFPCDKSLGFHVVVQGEAFIHRAGRGKPIALTAGDVALMARGCDHIISTEESRPKSVIEMASPEGGALRSGPALRPPLLTLVSGAYQFWNTPVHPFFRELPDWHVFKSRDVGPHGDLQTAIRMLGHESQNVGFGSETVIQALLDVIFTHILRQIVESVESSPRTWSFALHDAQIRRALELMHGDCARDWKLEELARAVGLSRAGFAQKFKHALGDTPLHYLATVRVQKAMELLSATDEKVETVAEAVGYKDAFSFSKVFKKFVGIPPKEFRRKDRDSQNLPWRF